MLEREANTTPSPTPIFMAIRLRNKDGTLGAPLARRVSLSQRIISQTNRERTETTPTVQTPPPASINPQVGVRMPTFATTGNVIDGTTGQNIPVVTTATRGTSLRGNIGRIYNAVDNKAFGLLPFGVSPTQSATDRTVRRTTETEALNRARIEAQKQQDTFLLQKLAQETNTATQEQILKEMIDQARTRGLENFGLFQSEQEKSVQELLSRQAYLNSLSQNIPQLQEAFLSAQQSAGGAEAFQSFNDSLQPQEDKGFFDSIGDGLKGAGVATIVLVGAGLFLLSRNK